MNYIHDETIHVQFYWPKIHNRNDKTLETHMWTALLVVAHFGDMPTVIFMKINMYKEII